jgi:hypothetical protein
MWACRSRVAFAQEGCEVIAVDVDSRKIAVIEADDSYRAWADTASP